jgi:hypothetical protein
MTGDQVFSLIQGTLMGTGMLIFMWLMFRYCP